MSASSGNEFKGMLMALAGALVLTPDALFMRLSGLDSWQMLAWRGLGMGAVMTLAWLILSRDKGRDLGAAFSLAGLGAIFCQALNVTFFATGIGNAPVASVLFGLASVPVVSAIMGGLILKDRIGRATWVTSAVVIVGILISLSGGHGQTVGNPLIGVACGFGVAIVMSGSFTIYRGAGYLPTILTLGWGAALGGSLGFFIASDLTPEGSNIWAILVCGLFILPLSFFLMSSASRLTLAANVSLFLLLETVMAPVLVWAIVGEQLTPQAIVGGIIVVGAVGTFLLRERRKARRARRMQAIPR